MTKKILFKIKGNFDPKDIIRDLIGDYDTEHEERIIVLSEEQLAILQLS